MTAQCESSWTGDCGDIAGRVAGVGEVGPQTDRIAGWAGTDQPG